MSQPSFAVHVLSHVAPSPVALPAEEHVRRDAVIGFALAGIAPVTHQQRLDGQVRLYACLPRAGDFGPSVEVAYALHYVVNPPGPDHKQAEIQSVLLAHIAEWHHDPAHLQVTAHEVGDTLRALLATSLPAYRFAPITKDADLQRVLAPFPIQDLVEIRPRWVALADRVHLPVPLAGIPSIDTLIALMTQEVGRCVLSIGFTPVSLGLPPLGALHDTAESPFTAPSVGAALPYAKDIGSTGAKDARDTRSAMSDFLEYTVAQRWARERVTDLYQPFQLSIQIASASKIRRALINVAAAEFGGPSKLSPASFWNSAVSITEAGANIVAPRTTPSTPPNASASHGTPVSEFALAEANLRSVRTTAWGAHPDAPKCLFDFAVGKVCVSELATLVSLSELARLAAFPLEAPWLPLRGAILPLPYTGGPARGVRLGINTARGEPVAVHWPHQGRTHHAVLVGGTGMGKSTLAHHLIMDDIANGRGVIVLDPHDQLVENVLELIPSRRMKDVILFDTADFSRPLGINPMDLATVEQQSQFITRFLGQLRHMYDRNQLGMVGPVAMMTLRNGMQAIMGLPHGGTLLEVFRLFNDDDFLAAVLPFIRDNTVRMFFRQFRLMEPHTRAEYVTHGVSKISEWVTDPVMQRIIGQRKSSFDFATAMNTGAIVLCQLRSGILGSDLAAFLGHTLLPMVYQAALSRLALPPRQRHPCSLYIDEAGTFTGDPSIARMLAECRKAMLSVNLIYQYTAQAEPSVREAILANVGSIFAFRTSLADAAIMEQLFAPSPVTARDLTQLPRGVAYSSILLEEGQRTPVFALETELPTGRARPTRAASIRRESAQRYGRVREEIDAILARRNDAHRWVREGDQR